VSTVAWAYRTGASMDEATLQLATLEAAGREAVGLLGISEEEGRATLWFTTRVGDLPLAGRWEPVDDRGWQVAWREGLEPVVVGAVTITPPWRDPAGDLVVTVDPGQAFGTGHHETTTGCLAALQELPLTGRALLDVGTGSGVLAIAAALLGAAPVVAIDTDPQAAAAARSNAAANGAAVEVLDGSVEVVDGRTFDVVVANLDTNTIVRLAPALVAATAASGSLIVSGVSVDRLDEAAEALRAAGVDARPRPGREWAVLVAQRA